MNPSISKSLVSDFQSIFKSTPDLYLILSPRLEIVEVNEAYLKATMVKREEILGRQLFDVFPDNPKDPNSDGVGNLRASLERVLRYKKADTMAVQKYDIRRPQTEGGEFEERYWSPINTPVLGKDKEVKYIIHRVVDVTDWVHLKHPNGEAKQPLKAPRRKEDLFETELYQRAREIQDINEQLREVNQELLKKETALLHANQELEAFSYSVSHDLRNPIQSIAGFSALLLEYADLTTEEKDYLSEIISAAQNMNELIVDLLHFSQSTRCEMNYDLVDLSAIVSEIAAQLKKQNPQRHFQFIIEPKVEARCDAHLMKIVFQNLLQNACKFTAKTAKPRIEFGVLAGERPIYYVRDNGVGYPPDKADKLFQPFSRLHPAETFMGTGIGLATVKRVIDRHRGRVWAESMPGQGATFYLRF